MKIVSDTCMALSEELKKKINPTLVPFKITVDGVEYTDDDSIDPDELTNLIVNAKTAPKTACPSPHEFEKAMNDDEHDEVFVVALTGAISGTYNSAMLAKKSLQEKIQKNIHIFDSRACAGGETLIALKIKELMDMGKNFSDIVVSVEEYIKDLRTMFIVESLNNLVKNGRISSWKAKIAQALNITPIMCDKDGAVELYKKVRGKERAFKELVASIKTFAEATSRKVITIVHINNLERAEKLKEELEKLNQFKEIIIIKGHGIISVYADNKGIVVNF